MVGHVFRVEKLPHNLCEVDGRHIVSFHQLVHGSIFGRHLIFSQSWEGNLCHIRQVLQTL